MHPFTFLSGFRVGFGTVSYRAMIGIMDTIRCSRD